MSRHEPDPLFTPMRGSDGLSTLERVSFRPWDIIVRKRRVVIRDSENSEIDLGTETTTIVGDPIVNIAAKAA